MSDTGVEVSFNHFPQLVNVFVIKTSEMYTYNVSRNKPFGGFLG